MNKVLTGLCAIALGLGLATPAKALTKEEAAKIAIGVDAITCIAVEGCPSYRTVHYNGYHNRGYGYNRGYSYKNRGYGYGYRDRRFVRPKGFIIIRGNFGNGYYRNYDRRPGYYY